MKVFLIVLGVFVYLVISGMFDAEYDDLLVSVFWPIILVIGIPFYIGSKIYKHFKKKGY